MTDAEAIGFRKATYYSIGNDGHGMATLVEVSWWPKHWDPYKMDAPTTERYGTLIVMTAILSSQSVPGHHRYANVGAGSKFRRAVG